MFEENNNILKKDMIFLNIFKVFKKDILFLKYSHNRFFKDFLNIACDMSNKYI